MPYVKHDAPPPPAWPTDISFLVKCRLSPSFPLALIPHIVQGLSTTSRITKYDPKPIQHPGHLSIKRISDPSHPAHGQAGLFAKKRIGPGELIVPYLGIIHHSSTPTTDNADGLAPANGNDVGGKHEHSDYDLSLIRISAHDLLNPYPGHDVSIGVDANNAGNAARFVNDYRGIATEPNAEFRLGQGASGELRMEIWSLKRGIGKGEEILVSYGKSWWSARRA